jgi:hypothetical protein
MVEEREIKEIIKLSHDGVSNPEVFGQDILEDIEIHGIESAEEWLISRRKSADKRSEIDDCEDYLAIAMILAGRSDIEIYNKLLSIRKRHPITHEYEENERETNNADWREDFYSDLDKKGSEKIFISYSHKDSHYANILTETLERFGLHVWKDDRIEYGTQWPRVIQDHLDRCSALIVVMSENSYKSEWVQSELNRAKRKGKPIFPLLLDGDGPWLSVESTQYVDVRDGKLPPPRFFDLLGRVIKGQ